jgi:diguanylate cyclase (GGDEF)-like protein
MDTLTPPGAEPGPDPTPIGLDHARMSSRRGVLLDAMPSLVTAADADALCAALAWALASASDAIGVAVDLALASGPGRAAAGIPEEEEGVTTHVVAIREGGHVYGQARIVLPERLRGEVAHDIAAVISLAGATATRLEQLSAARLEARFDWLTGVGNRRAFEAELAAELVTGESLSLALIDVDDLKSINDSYGHAAGDVALRGLARTALRVTRTSDRIFRIGGDEFALVLRTDERAAERLVIRLQRALASGRRYTSHTFSAGISSTPHAGTDPSELLRCADVALLRAKTAGKDSVICASDLTSAPNC